MKKDDKYKEEAKELYRKAAETSLLISGLLEEDTTPPSEQPTEPTDMDNQSK